MSDAPLLKNNGTILIYEGKVIRRKSNTPANSENGESYMSRIDCCDSCMDDQMEGYEPIYSDYCCCIHSQFAGKKDENKFVKESGFWKLTTKEKE